MKDLVLEKEILRPLWKVHILHHASKGEVIGNWMLEELREHGYRVSPGTLYPLLARMEKRGWLERSPTKGGGRSKDGRPYRATAAGRNALLEVEARLTELIGEVHDGPPKHVPDQPLRGFRRRSRAKAHRG